MENFRRHAGGSAVQFKTVLLTAHPQSRNRDIGLTTLSTQHSGPAAGGGHVATGNLELIRLKGDRQLRGLVLVERWSHSPPLASPCLVACGL